MAGLLQVMLHRGLRFRDYAEVIETLISWRVLRDGIPRAVSPSGQAGREPVFAPQRRTNELRTTGS
jgi:hypothetical protein